MGQSIRFSSSALRHQDDFKIRNRSLRLFGYWIASLLDLSAPEAEQYVEDLLMFHIRQGEAALLDKVLEDFSDAHILISEKHLTKQLDTFWDTAGQDFTGH